jgi:hypothetical protein
VAAVGGPGPKGWGLNRLQTLDFQEFRDAIDAAVSVGGQNQPVIGG